MGLWRKKEETEEITIGEPLLPDDQRLIFSSNYAAMSSRAVDPLPYLQEAGIRTLADLKEILSNERVKAFKRKRAEERFKHEKELYEKVIKETE